MDPLSLLFIVFYAASGVFYLGFHLGMGQAAARVGRYTLMAAFGLQLVDIGLRCFRLQHPLSSLSEAMAFIAWLIAGGMVIASFRYRLSAAGAFAVPVVLVLLVLARVGPETATSVPLVSRLGTVHILLATVGVATFALAAVVALVYLLQEKRLKSKKLDVLRNENTPLDTLDRLAARCVSVGFPVFTLTIVTGAVWIAQLGWFQTGRAMRPEYLLTIIAWAVSGVLLFARVGAGWRGRRAAWLTVGGFSAAALVLVGYLIRNTA